MSRDTVPFDHGGLHSCAAVVLRCEGASRERTVGQLGEPFAISFAAASKHVKVLERAGLVERRVAGRTHVCRLAPEPIEEAFRWLARYQRFWEERLGALEAELRREDDAS